MYRISRHAIATSTLALRLYMFVACRSSCFASCSDLRLDREYIRHLNYLSRKFSFSVQAGLSMESFKEQSIQNPAF